MADIDYTRLANEFGRVVADIIDERGLSKNNSSGYYRRNRFIDDDDGEGYYDERNFVGTGKTSVAFNKAISSVSKFAAAVEGVVNHIKNIDRELNNIAGSWKDVDDAAAKYARSMGMTIDGLNKARERAIRDTVHGTIGLEFGMDPAELMKAQSDYANAIGRSVRLSKEDHRSLAAITEVFQGSSTDLLDNFEKFGLSIDNAGKHLGSMYKEAGKAGISLEKYAKNVQQGLAMAQTYNFSNGLKGMEAMAKRATAIRMEMSQVSAFANNFDTVEKAIQNSAKLQVLGGSFTNGADALGLMHAALSDMDELEARMEDFTRGIAVFNRSTGTADISDVDRLRLKQYAEVTGQDFQKVMEVARRQTLRDEIGAQIATSKHAVGLSDEMKEMIKNVGTFENGQAGVSIQGEFKSIEDLVDKDLQKLREEQFNDSDNIKDIAKNVRSLAEMRKGVGAQYRAVESMTTGSLVGNAMKGITGMFTKMGEAANALLGLVVVGKFALSALSMIRGGRSIVRGGRYIGSLFKGGSAQIETSQHAIGGLRNFFGGRGSNMAANQFTKEGTAIYNAAGKRIYGAAAESRVKSVGMKEATKVATKSAAKTSTTKIATEAATNAATKAATDAATKAAASTAAKTGAKKLVTGVAKGGGVGIIGAIGNMATDYLVDTGKIKKAGTTHGVLKTTSSALEGAGLGMAIGGAIGTVVPVIGNAVGATVGAVIGAIGGATVGLIKTAKAKNEVIVDNQLQALGIERKGNYSLNKLKDIDKALQSGKMSNKLRKKLLKEGDTDIVNQINKVGEEKKAKKKEKLKSVANALGIGGKKEEAKKRIQTAHFDIQNGYFGGRGGILRGNTLGGGVLTNATRRGKETVVRGLRAATNILSAPIELIKGKKEKGESKELSAFQRIRENANRDFGRTNRDEGYRNGPIEVNINGTIKLEAPNGESFDLMTEIRKNPALLNKLTEEIVKQMNIRKNGAYVHDRANGDNFV